MFLKKMLLFLMFSLSANLCFAEIIQCTGKDKDGHTITLSEDPHSQDGLWINNVKQKLVDVSSTNGDTLLITCDIDKCERRILNSLVTTKDHKYIVERAEPDGSRTYNLTCTQPLD